MINRIEYMENSTKLHDIYYRQFVTAETIAFVENNIGIEKLQQSTCKHLNDVVKWEQGGRTWAWDRSPINVELAKLCGEGLSLSTRTCVGKAAARMILEREEAAKNIEHSD